MLYDCKEIRKVSPNLSLRFSPERKCSPCHSHIYCSPPESPINKCRPCSPVKTTAELLSNSRENYHSPCKKINYNEYEENQFNDFLRKLMVAESQIEDAKVSLSLRPDFNC